MKHFETDDNLSIDRQIKLEKISAQISRFKNTVAINFNGEDSATIEKAMDLMIEVHIDQKDRLDGAPYISHPLEIADDIITKFKIRDKDILIAALLHDSIEDQSHLLSQKFLSENKFDEVVKNNNSYGEKRNAGLAIQKLFGLTAESLVKALTNPDFAELNGDNIDKNDLYKRHVENAVRNPYVCVIKYADFRRNALRIHNLKEGERKQSLLRKYGPVIKDVFLPLFKTITEGHPLFHKREDMIKELTDCYKQNYLKELI